MRLQNAHASPATPSTTSTTPIAPGEVGRDVVPEPVADVLEAQPAAVHDLALAAEVAHEVRRVEQRRTATPTTKATSHGRRTPAATRTRSQSERGAAAGGRAPRHLRPARVHGRHGRRQHQHPEVVLGGRARARAATARRATSQPAAGGVVGARCAGRPRSRLVQSRRAPARAARACSSTKASSEPARPPSRRSPPCASRRRGAARPPGSSAADQAGRAAEGVPAEPVHELHGGRAQWPPRAGAPAGSTAWGRRRTTSATSRFPLPSSHQTGAASTYSAPTR